MTVIISGSTGITDVNGSAAAPAITGTDTDTGVFFGTNTVSLSTGGTERLQIDSSGNLGLGVTPSAWSQLKGFQLVGGSSVASQTNALYLLNNAFYDGSAWKYINTSAATRLDLSGGAATFYNAASGTAGNTITFTQAMTLDASGNLGLGVTSPYSLVKQDVQIASATTNWALNVRSYDAGTGDGTTTAKVLRTVNSGNGNWAVAQYDAWAHIWTKAGTETARIDSSGNLLVGKTTTSGTTVGFAYINGSSVQYAQSASTNANSTWETYSTGAGAYRFYVGMGGTIYATSTTITAISDQRLKENIQDLDVGLDAVMALKPRKFDWKEGKGKNKKGDRGWIAQEFEQVFPDMIDEWRDPAPEGEEPYKAVNADLIPVLVKAIQELNAKFEAYKATHP